MLPLFKKSHIHSRQIENYLKTGFIKDFPDDANKRNALRQAGHMFRIVDGELFRHGTEREYDKYGLRLVIHDDQPEKKAEIIGKCHIDPLGNHLGMNSTIKNVTDTYYWQGISAHVKMYLKQCEQCKVRSKLTAEEWLKMEKQSIEKKKEMANMTSDTLKAIKQLGRVKKPTPPETFFIVNERKVDVDSSGQETSMTIDSNNIEYVVETLGQCDFEAMEEVCHVLNVPDIIPTPERFRSREIETYLKDGTFPDDFTTNMRNGMKGPASQYSIIEGELYHESSRNRTKELQLVIHDDMPALKVKVMVEAHIDEDGSHCGLNKTIAKLNEKYYWMGMSLDVRKFMLHCKICAELRGKKREVDRKTYDEEAKEVRTRHLKKMSEMEGTDNSFIQVPIGMATEGVQTNEAVEEDGHQVIRLIGPNKEITEITVAVVSQETVSSESGDVLQNINKTKNVITTEASLAGSRKPIITKEMTDAVAQIEAAEAAMELEEEPAETAEAFDSEAGRAETGIETVVVTTASQTASSSAVETDIAARAGESQESEMEVGTQGENVDYLIIREGEEEMVEAEEDNVHDETFSAQMPEKIVEVGSGDYVASKAGLYSFYKGFIYVPKIKKTRIIENFIKHGECAPGYSHDKLYEMSTNFEVVDDVLCKRQSRYKWRLTVIHDDEPELKLKLIEENHQKRNGMHCTDLVTIQNVSYKYYWEELKWDVIRWYPSCRTCVKDGIERRTSKKVLSVIERKKFLEERKMINKIVPVSARALRSGNKVKIEKVADWEKIIEISRAKRGKPESDGCGGQVIRIYPGDSKATEEDEDSDLEMIVPSTSGEHQAGSLAEVDEAGEYDLMVFSTLDQEQVIRQMFEEQGWDYDHSALSKVLIEESLKEEKNHYLITLRVTEVQEQAIKDLFETLGIDIDDSVAKEAVTEDLPTIDKDQLIKSGQRAIEVKSEDSSQARTANNQAIAIQPLEGLPVNVGCQTVEEPLESVASPKGFVQLGANLIHQQPWKGPGSPQKVIVNIQPSASKLKTTVTSVQASNLLKPLVTHVSETPAQSSTVRTIRTPEIRQAVQRSAVRVIRTPDIRPAAQKRPLEESTSASTPGSETRRSRREIKKPRRFSPDSSPAKSPSVAVKAEREEQAESVAKESQDMEVQSDSQASKSQAVEGVNYEKSGSVVKSDVGNNTRSGNTGSRQITKGVSLVQVEESLGQSSSSVSRVTRSGKTTAQVQRLANTGTFGKPGSSETLESLAGPKEEITGSRAKVSVVKKQRIVMKKADTIKDIGNGNEVESDGELHDVKRKDTSRLVPEEGKSQDDEDDENADDMEIEEDDDDEYDDDDGQDDDNDDEDDSETSAALDVLYVDGVKTMEPIKVENGYACSLCSAKFPTERLCKKHGEQNICYEQCELCGKLIKRKDAAGIKDHTSIHEKNKKFPCSKCKKVFYDKEMLSVHSRKHKGDYVAKCSTCKEEFNTWFLYASHMLRVHDEHNMFTCDVCKAKFVNISFMKSEVLFDGELSMFRCVMCSN